MIKHYINKQDTRKRLLFVKKLEYSNFNRLQYFKSTLSEFYLVNKFKVKQNTIIGT